MSFIKLFITGRLNLSCCDSNDENDENDDENYDIYDFGIVYDCPDIKIGQISEDGRVNGVLVNLDEKNIYLLIGSNYYEVTIKNINVYINKDNNEYITKYEDSDNDSDEKDYINGYIDGYPFLSVVSEIKKYLKDNIIITIDDHWDCYCKTQTICGCGCDSKHDGW